MLIFSNNEGKSRFNKPLYGLTGIYTLSEGIALPYVLSLVEVNHYLGSAIEGFKVNFRPWLLKLLLEFKPYRNLLQYAREHDLIEGTFGSYQAQTSKHKGIIRQREIAKDSDWNSREILSHQAAINSIKENQWAFKAIFQKAIVRLGRIVEFDYKAKDKNLGNIDDVLSCLDRLYDKGILKVDADLPDYPFRLWTFVAINQGTDKIK
ncbi:MAG: hypothetical protein ACYTXY_33365, partial [Nostoc sp.]